MIDVRFLCYEDLDEHDNWPSKNWSQMYDFFYIDRRINKECLSVLKKDKAIIIDESEYLIEDIKFDVDTNIFYCNVYPNYVYKLRLK